MRVVRFVKGNAPYNAGEVAGFDEDIAARLIEAGVAVPYEEDAPDQVQAAAVEGPPAHRAMKAPKKKGE